MGTEVVIASIARTPVGAFNGTLGQVPASTLGAVAIRAALARAGVASAEVGEVIMGQVLVAAQGQNPARQASMEAGIPCEVPAWGMNQICGSGLRAVALASQAVALGDSDIVVAGGQESMSLATHCVHLRGGVRMGNATLVDSMVVDGLTDVFNRCHMGITAENVAKRHGISREDQDSFALLSQHRAEAAQKAGHFRDEITPVTVRGRKGETVFDADEYIRRGAVAEDLGRLRPAFDREGTVTAGNASGLNDGAAAAVVMSAATAEKRGIRPLARIVSWGQAGVDPAVMGTGPVPATRNALRKAGWEIGDLDLIEANEAFAAQALAVNRELGLDPGRVNVSGGAIAIGHPIGASGARILATLLYGMQRLGARRGLATLCIGGGMGVALCVERMD